MTTQVKGSVTQNIYDDFAATTGADLVGLTNGTVKDAINYVTPQMFGAKGDGTTDDSTAIQNAINSVTDGGILFIPSTGYSYLISNAIIISKSITISGQSPSTQFYIPTANVGFDVQADDVSFYNLFFKGNRINNSSNISIHLSKGNARLSIDKCKFENLYTGVKIEGGYFHRFTNLTLRNNVSSSFLLKDYNGVNGNDALFNGCYHDVDGSYSQPTCVIWCQDFDALIVDNSDFIHGGTSAAIYINPQTNKSNNHVFGTNLYCDTTQGAGIQFSPSSSSQSNRNFINGTWFSTCGTGVTVSGAGNVDGVVITGAKFHHNNNQAILWTNTGVSGNLWCTSSAFSSNNQSASNTNDIEYDPGSSVVGKLRVSGCTFSIGFGWVNGAVYNVSLGTNATNAELEGNSFGGFSGAAAINGLSTLTQITRNNSGFVTEKTFTATIPSGNKTVTVNHGLDRTPILSNFVVTPTSGWGGGGEFWLSGVTSSQITINTLNTTSNNVGFTVHAIIT